MARIFTALALIVMVAFPADHSAAEPMAVTLAKTGLKPADIEMMTATAASLYETGTPKVGSKAEWANSETGSRGIVELVGKRDNCVELLHYFRPANATRTQQYRAGRCKIADGKWEMTAG